MVTNVFIDCIQPVQVLSVNQAVLELLNRPADAEPISEM